MLRVMLSLVTRDEGQKEDQVDEMPWLLAAQSDSAALPGVTGLVARWRGQGGASGLKKGPK